jgi:hypothetical protein
VSLQGLIVPPGRALASAVGAWAAAVRAAPELEQLRIDARTNVLAVVEVLARRASWDLLTSWPTWQRLQDETELSRATVARWLAWLRRYGWLAVVETGSTPRTRPMALAHLDGNRAAVYALLVAAPIPAQPAGDQQSLAGERAELVDEQTGEILTSPAVDRPSPDTAIETSETPTGSRRESCTSDLGYRRNARAHANVHARHDLPRTAPRTKIERLEAVEAMRQLLPLFRLRSPRLLAHVLRDWFDAGWSPYDLAWHLDHRPTGNPAALTGVLATTALVDAEPWPYAWSRATDIRNVIGWILTRLRAWSTPDGEIPPSRTQRLEAARIEQLAVQRARADTDARRLATAARGETVHRHAATARENIRAALRSAARPAPAGPSGQVDQPGPDAR